MTNYILGVEYKSLPLTVACIRVAGETQQLALQRAKKIGGVLVKELPDDADLLVPRLSHPKGDLCVYEVRATIESCVAVAKPIINELVLRGSV